MDKIKPIGLIGHWDKGYALDLHTTNSFPYLDEFGQVRYQNFYSTLGEALNRFKYHDDFHMLSEIMTLICPFLDIWKDLKLVELVIPVPPSKKDRKYQPSMEIAFEVAKYLHADYCDDIIFNDSIKEVKFGDRAGGSIKLSRKPQYRYNILLVDDIYNSGKTITNCVELIKQNRIAYKIFVLTMTKARAGGLQW